MKRLVKWWCIQISCKKFILILYIFFNLQVINSFSCYKFNFDINFYFPYFSIIFMERERDDCWILVKREKNIVNDSSNNKNGLN